MLEIIYTMVLRVKQIKQSHTSRSIARKPFNSKTLGINITYKDEMCEMSNDIYVLLR